MAKKGGVSGKTHTQQQLNDYANQHNPNNKSYWANQRNKSEMKNAKRNKYDIGILEGESYGWGDDQSTDNLTESISHNDWCFLLPVAVRFIIAGVNMVAQKSCGYEVKTN